MCAYDIDESSEFAEQYGVKTIPQVFVFCMFFFVALKISFVVQFNLSFVLIVS